MSRIGMIGLGNMGGAIAERLVIVGHEVVGFDLGADACERAAAVGIRIADQASDVLIDAEFVLSSLPNPAIVKNVWLGADRLIDRIPGGATFVELSTIDPVSMIEVADQLPASVVAVDCPVSGGPAEARDGQLSLMVGATDADFARVAEFLAGFGKTAHHAGPVGSGKAVKIVNNIMSMTNVLIASEAFSLGVAYGIDPHRLYDILSVSGGTSGQFVRRFPRAIDGDFAPRFALSLGTKDLGLALDFARSLRAPVPATALAHEMYALAEANGLGDDDHVALLKMYSNWMERR
jgi:3-hydroxyisobutyrate dehydrogenase-like beta-hydroxyacid dehydrogenase